MILEAIKVGKIGIWISFVKDFPAKCNLHLAGKSLTNEIQKIEKYVFEKKVFQHNFFWNNIFDPNLFYHQNDIQLHYGAEFDARTMANATRIPVRN